VAVLAARGADVREVRLPYWREMVTANIVTIMSEALAYHRGDLASRWDDYFAATRMVIAQGALLSAADYVQAQRVRRVAQQAVGDLFTEVDLIAAPTVQAGAISYRELGERGLGGRGRPGAMINTGYWDCVGNPALALPIGFTADGLPLSMQLAARPFDEAAALQAGQVYQEATRWHREQPALAGGL
jgi:aspartyl-tRNA(Asn)/glutamyl-tRNA(Gln) amidotransferase subunit A